MRASQRLDWLRRVLLVKVVLCFLVWGLPALPAPPTLLPWFGLTIPEDPIFLRLFGALAIALGVAYGYAYQDPVKNAAIVRVGVVDNAGHTDSHRPEPDPRRFQLVWVAFGCLDGAIQCCIHGMNAPGSKQCSAGYVSQFTQKPVYLAVGPGFAAVSWVGTWRACAPQH
jgi:hypothetical protein